jgi:hypothetical protein
MLLLRLRLIAKRANELSAVRAEVWRLSENVSSSAAGLTAQDAQGNVLVIAIDRGIAESSLVRMPFAFRAS